MRSFISSFGAATARIFDVTAIFCNAAVACLVLSMVIVRYILNLSVVGLDELALICAMWLYMTGAMIASRHSEHLVVDFLSKQIKSPAMKRIYNRFIALIMVGASLFFMYLAWHMLSFSLRLPQTTPGLDIPEIIPQMSIIVASIGSFFYATRELITGIGCHNQDDPGDA